MYACVRVCMFVRELVWNVSVHVRVCGVCELVGVYIAGIAFVFPFSDVAWLQTVVYKPVC